MSERYKCFKTKDTASPASKKFLALISNHRINQRMASLIFQLWVGHSLFNSYLHCFKKVDSTRCPACKDSHEMIKHFLLQCPKFAHKQWPLLALYNGRTLKLTELFFNQKTIIPLINYIEVTKQFHKQQEGLQEDAAVTQEQDQM